MKGGVYRMLTVIPAKGFRTHPLPMYPEPVPVIICTECLGDPLVTFVRQFKIFVHSRFHKKHEIKKERS